MNNNKLLAISPTLPGLKATFFLPIYQVPDIVYPPLCLLGKMYYAIMQYMYIVRIPVHTQPKSDVENTCHPFLSLLMEKRGNFLCKFIFNCVKDSKLQNGTMHGSLKYSSRQIIPSLCRCSILLSLFLCLKNHGVKVNIHLRGVITTKATKAAALVYF